MGLDDWDTRACVCNHVACLIHVNTARKSGPVTLFGQPQRILLDGQILLRNPQLTLKLPQLDIIDRHLRDQADKDVSQRFLARLQARLGRLDRPPHPAEDVHFPAGVKPGTEQAASRAVSHTVGGAANADQARGRNGGKTIGFGHTPAGPRFAQRCLGPSQIQVSPDRPIDKAFEDRVFQGDPPVGKRLIIDRGVLKPARKVCIPIGRRRCRRFLVVRPNRGARELEEYREQQQRAEEIACFSHVP